MEIDKRHSTKVMNSAIRRIAAEESGTTFSEFGLVFVLIAVVVFVMAIVAGGGSLVFFQQVDPIG
jgi:Flp pilus assembly pilin Flp